MVDLVACGPQPTQQWRQTLRVGETMRLGRAPRDTGGWAVPWDYLISREHADVQWNGDELLVRCLPTARNPVYYRERPTAEFAVSVGEEFRIGTTRFRLETTAAEPRTDDEEPSGIEERSFSARELRQVVFGNAGGRMEVLCQLPRLISRSRTDEEFAGHLTDLLLAAIPRSDAVAVIAGDDPDESAHGAPSLLRWNSRQTDLSGFRPSQGLVQAAVTRGESVVHIWSDLPDEEPVYTVSANFEWAYCTPIPGRGGRVWCLYVSGQRDPAQAGGVLSADDLKGDVRFTQLLAQFIGAIRKVRRLENQQAGMAQFFSPAVMESLTDSRADVILTPRESEITVLLCDLRGFSRAAERARQDLRALLDRVSAALGVMTRSILRYDGVVADFQGDAAVGFWGWPLRSPDGPLLAARAALLIQSEFQQAEQQSGSHLHDFRIGIGIAHGQAVAGKVGTDQQSKIGAFGPVVELGGRLESLTKTLRAPILLDEVTTEFLRQHLPPAEGRVRRLGRLRPAGGNEVLSPGELLPAEGRGSSLTDDDLRRFEQAVSAVGDGRWDEALRHLESLPATDRTKDFLMISIALNDYHPPTGWDGVVDLPGK